MSDMSIFLLFSGGGGFFFQEKNLSSDFNEARRSLGMETEGIISLKLIERSCCQNTKGRRSQKRTKCQLSSFRLLNRKESSLSPSHHESADICAASPMFFFFLILIV